MAEMKARYKKTDTGVISEDWDADWLHNTLGRKRSENWQSKPLNELACIKKGLQLNRETLDDSGEYPVWNGGITPSGYTNEFNASANTITISEGGNSCGFVNFCKENFWLGGHCYAVEKLDSSVNTNFLFFFLKANEQRIMELRVGSGLPNIQKKNIERLPIQFPEIRTQNAIAVVLADVDGLIESLEKLIAKKRNMKTATMQQLLTGKKRLPGFGDSFTTQETIFGKVPKDWQIKTLQSLCTFENGDRGSNYPSKSDFQLTGVPFVNAGHLKNKKVQLDDMDFITYEKYDQLGNGKFKIGDILFCLRGSLGKYAVIKKSNLFGAIASSLIIIKPKKGLLDSAFFEFYLESEHCEKMIDLFAGGAAQPNLGGQDLSKFFILLPSTPEEQKAIAQILSDMDAEIESLEKRLEKVHNLKIGMMQELLTGKTRLIKAYKI